MPPYEQKRNSRQILLKIVSSDEQKRNSPQILLKIVGKKYCLGYECRSR